VPSIVEPISQWHRAPDDARKTRYEYTRANNQHQAKSSTRPMRKNDLDVDSCTLGWDRLAMFANKEPAGESAKRSKVMQMAGTSILGRMLEPDLRLRGGRH